MDDQTGLELPEEGKRDKAYTLFKAIASEFPGAGTVLEVLELIVTPSLEKRRDEFLQAVFKELVALQNKFTEFEIQEARKNESFVTTFYGAYRVAITTHQREKHQALCNAVLNSALPEAPDDTRQKMFIQWLDELTVWHLKILEMFGRPGIPVIYLDSSDWRMDFALKKLGDLIEATYPHMEGQYGLYVKIIQDLHSMGLIANNIPSPGPWPRLAPSPELTSLAKDFLAFIKSPLNKI